MPTSSKRREVGIRRDLFERVEAIAKREGRPTQRQFDLILEGALDNYTAEQRQRRYPIAEHFMDSAKKLLADTRRLRSVRGNARERR